MVEFTERERILLDFLRKVDSKEFLQAERKRNIYKSLQLTILIILAIAFSNYKIIVFILLAQIIINFISGVIMDKSRLEMYQFVSKRMTIKE